MRGLRRLLAHIGMTLATTVVYGGLTLVLIIPIWYGLLTLTLTSTEFVRHFLLRLFLVAWR